MIFVIGGVMLYHRGNPNHWSAPFFVDRWNFFYLLSRLSVFYCTFGTLQDRGAC